MGIDVTTLSLAKKYADKKIQQAELGDINLDTTLTLPGFAADAKSVGDAINNIEDENFYVLINYDDDSDKFSLNGIATSEITEALNKNQVLIAKVTNKNGGLYCLPLVSKTTNNGILTLSFSNGSSITPKGEDGALTVMIIGTAALISFNSIGSVNASKVACNVTINGEPKVNVADALDALAVGGDSGFNLPLLYETTTTEEVRWIDTGEAAFIAKNMLIIEFLSKATATNTQNNNASCSAHSASKKAQSPFSNYAIAHTLKEALSMQYDKYTKIVAFRGNDGVWVPLHIILNVVNPGGNYPTMTGVNYREDITGIIIGDASALTSETRVMGVGTTLKIWGC